MYVASADAHVGDANDHIVRVFDNGKWLVFESGVPGSIEQARWVLHFRCRWDDGRLSWMDEPSYTSNPESGGIMYPEQ